MTGSYAQTIGSRQERRQMDVYYDSIYPMRWRTDYECRCDFKGTGKKISREESRCWSNGVHVLWSECGVVNQDIWIELLTVFARARGTAGVHRPALVLDSPMCHITKNVKAQARQLGILLLVPPPPLLCNSYAIVQATAGVGTVLIWYVI